MSSFHLGATRRGEQHVPYELPADHLVTHGVVAGMTGSGETGLLTVMVEEALREDIPVLMIDVKGDLPNLLLTLPQFTPGELAPWVELPQALSDEQRRAALLQRVESRTASLAQWGTSPIRG